MMMDIRVGPIAMYRFRLNSDQVQLELVANGQAQRLPFQVLGPTTEVAFLEELIDERFGGLTVNPAQLFSFLNNDPWVRDFFQSPDLVEGQLHQDHHASQASDTFDSQPLGCQLVTAGVINLEELEQLLDDYRPFAETQRFGEFLRLNLQVPPQILDFLLHSSLLDSEGFNEKRLGERLISLGAINEQQLHQALQQQAQQGGRIGEVLAANGLISPTMALFFSRARISAQGEIEYEADEHSGAKGHQPFGPSGRLGPHRELSAHPRLERSPGRRQQQFPKVERVGGARS